MRNIIISALVGLIVGGSGASFFAYQFGYSDGFVTASNKATESWLVQTKEMVKENTQFMRESGCSLPQAQCALLLK